MSRLFEQENVKKKTLLSKVLTGILGEISALNINSHNNDSDNN